MAEQIIDDSKSHKYYVVHHADLPISCPTPDDEQWSSHPKVYLSLEVNIRKSCPYCGKVYMLVDE